MSSLGLDPEVPLPPVDDDSELVGKNDKLGKPDPGEGTGSGGTPMRAAAMPVLGGIAAPIPATAESNADEVADDPDDDEQ